MKSTILDLKSKYSFFENVLGAFVFFCVSFLASLLVISTLFFVIKKPLSASYLIPSLILSLTLTFWYLQSLTENLLKTLLISFLSIILFLMLFGSSLLLSKSVFDLSYDGQAYHQEAIIQFSRGWNPVYMVLENEATANLERWLNHYPKGIWIFSSVVYDLTGDIESGKVLSMFSIFLAAICVLWCLLSLSRLSILLKLIVSLLLAFNPVAVYQSLSYYLDGVLVSLLLCLVFISVKLVITKDNRLLWPFSFLLIILVNIKLSSIVFTYAFVGAFIFYLWITDRHFQALRVVKYSVVSFILGVLLVGFNPFVTNLAMKGHPLYPAMGKNAYDYVPTNTPENYWGLTPPIRLVMSIFSYSSHARGENQFGMLKIPFSIKNDELRAFTETNTKLGGFGPLFSGVIIISLTTLLGITLLVKNTRKELLTLLGGLGFLVGMASLVSTSSVARYVPFVWWIPGLIVIYSFSRSFFFKVLGISVIIVSFVNIFLIAKTYYSHNFDQSKKLASQLEELSKRKENITVDVGLFGSTKLKLKKYAIGYEEVFKNTTCMRRYAFLVKNVSELCEFNEPTLSP